MAKPRKFSDSFTTEDASLSVEVRTAPGQRVEDVAVQIDCGGAIHGDEETLDVLIEMLEKAKENLLARKGKAAVNGSHGRRRSPYWGRGVA